MLLMHWADNNEKKKNSTRRCCVILNRSESVESVGTMGQMPLSYHGMMNARVPCSTASAAESTSQSSCPALTNEAEDVQQFLTSHAVNGGIVNLLIAYLTELSQRCHLIW